MTYKVYSVQSRHRTYYTGMIGNERQVLMGWRQGIIDVLVFDQHGKLIEHQKHDLEIDPKFRSETEAIARKRIIEIQRSLSFRRGLIRIAPFIAELGIGLKQFPVDLEEFLEQPDRFPVEDVEFFRADIEEWQRAGFCVLTWGNDYALAADGRTI